MTNSLSAQLDISKLRPLHFSNRYLKLIDEINGISYIPNFEDTKVFYLNEFEVQNIKMITFLSVYTIFDGTLIKHVEQRNIDTSTPEIFKEFCENDITVKEETI